LSDDNRALSRVYNGLENVVVTDSYTPADDNPWHDTTTVVSGAEVGAWITHARHGEDGDVLVFGSRTLWNALLADNLVDELHLVVGSVVLVADTPLFSASVDGLTLLDVRRFEGSDNVLHCYGAPKARSMTNRDGRGRSTGRGHFQVRRRLRCRLLIAAVLQRATTKRPMAPSTRSADVLPGPCR